MSQFRYQGKTIACLPLKTGDVFLHPGKTVELPETVDVVKTLVAKRLLVAVEPAQVSVETETARYTGPDTNGCGESGESPAPASTPEKPSRKKTDSA